MSGFERVVLDTSTLVSAALRVGSLPHRAMFQALTAGNICVCTSTLAELDEVLMRSKFDRYQPASIRRAFTAFVRLHAVCFEVSGKAISSVRPPCRDAKDNQFLALAQACDADVLVTSDSDLLVLHPWNGIPILTPALFLAEAGTH